MRSFIINITLLLVVGISLYYFVGQLKQESAQITKPVQTETLQLPEEETPKIQHPMPEPTAVLSPSAKNEIVEPEVITEYESPLPSLEESDAVIKNTLIELFSSDALDKLFKFQGFLHRFVVTVDSLTNQKLSNKFRLILPAQGKFLIQKDASGNIYLDPKNVERYKIYIQFIEAINTEQFVKLYTNFYPLIQEAYDALGYKERYFNDRFIEVIDHLLSTPKIEGTIRLVQPKVFYQYADQKLEALSAGQKIMLRIGHDNQAIVKSKLISIRTALTTPLNDE